MPDRRSNHDALLAAIELVHGLTIVALNAADFEGTGVTVVHPGNA